MRFYATLRPLVGGRRVVLEAGCATVRDVLAQLIARYPALTERLLDEQQTVRPYVAVMVDGRDIRHLSGMNTPVTSKSALDIFPPIAGG